MKVLLITLAAAVAVHSQAAPPLKNGPYPTGWKVPDINSPQVIKWLSQINMSAVPNFPPNPAANGSPGVPKTDPGSCDWTYNLCLGPTDISTCPVGYFGLTYDDGPTPSSPLLYDALAKTNQKASLFWIGSNVLANPAIALRACNDGHHIAVHTWSHQPSTSLSNAQFVAEIKWTETVIKDVCGITPKHFRPPFGDIDNRIRGLLAQMGYIAVIWDIDTNDWQMPPGGSRTAAQIDTQFAGWIADNKKTPTGHICLEHELYNTTVAEAIKQLPNIQANWKTMPVASCVNDSHPYQEINITYPTIANGMSNASVPVPANASSSVPPSNLPSGASSNASGDPTSGGPAVPSGPSSGPASAVNKTSAGALTSIAPLAISLVLMLAAVALVF